MQTAGYSGTPLVKKLGIKNGFTIRIVNQPDYYFALLEYMPEVTEVKEKNEKIDFIHYFTSSAEELKKELVSLKEEIKSGGMIWISWPKKASKVPTDITEDLIRSMALAIGLVDVKVCAVDETWSALKLVIPLKDR